MILALPLLQWVLGIHLGFASKKSLAGDRITLLSPTLMPMWFSVLPGFVPAGEALLLRQKAPKPLTPRLASLERTDANLRRADQLAELYPEICRRAHTRPAGG